MRGKNICYREVFRVRGTERALLEGWNGKGDTFSHFPLASVGGDKSVYHHHTFPEPEKFALASRRNMKNVKFIYYRLELLLR
jgi:hypothetical protein